MTTGRINQVCTKETPSVKHPDGVRLCIAHTNCERSAPAARLQSARNMVNGIRRRTPARRSSDPIRHASFRCFKSRNLLSPTAPRKPRKIAAQHPIELSLPANQVDHHFGWESTFSARTKKKTFSSPYIYVSEKKNGRQRQKRHFFGVARQTPLKRPTNSIHSTFQKDPAHSPAEGTYQLRRKARETASVQRFQKYAARAPAAPKPRKKTRQTASVQRFSEKHSGALRTSRVAHQHRENARETASVQRFQSDAAGALQSS